VIVSRHICTDMHRTGEEKFGATGGLPTFIWKMAIKMVLVLTKTTSIECSILIALCVESELCVGEADE